MLSKACREIGHDRQIQVDGIEGYLLQATPELLQKARDAFVLDTGGRPCLSSVLPKTSRFRQFGIEATPNLSDGRLPG